MGFAIDASGSLYQDGFQNEKEFVKNVVDKVGPVSESGLRVGVIVYSSNATIEIKFDDHFDNSDLKIAIDRLPFYSQNTRMDLGLIKAKELFAEENGGRGSSKKASFKFHNKMKPTGRSVREDWIWSPLFPCCPVNRQCSCKRIW